MVIDIKTLNHDIRRYVIGQYRGSVATIYFNNKTGKLCFGCKTIPWLERWFEHTNEFVELDAIDPDLFYEELKLQGKDIVAALFRYCYLKFKEATQLAA